MKGMIMALGGFANHVARVNLSDRTVTYEGVNEDDARKYIGARGLGVKYLLDNGPDVDPLSPDNMLALVNGPMTGSEVTMSGRLAFVTKSPLTGTVTDSHMGGWSAARLRWAGFDAVLITGKAAAPVYLEIENGEVEIKDASGIWGMGIHDTVKHFGSGSGNSTDVSVMSIGQAGENGVLFASFLNEDDRAAGRGGTGAVAGSKNLKCVVVRGTRDGRWRPEQGEARQKFREAQGQHLKLIMESPVTAPSSVNDDGSLKDGSGALSAFGTNVLMNAVNSIGGLGTKNSQTTQTTPEAADAVSGETMRSDFLTAEPTCHACPVACKKEVEITEGVHAGLKMESFEYEPAWSLGANCGNDDPAVIAKIIDQCNDYGMDAIEIGNAISMYMEASERGYVDTPLDWGDGAGMVQAAEDIAHGSGSIGQALGQGPAKAAAGWGHPEISMTVKGQAVPAYDPRGIKGEGLGYATSNRGACHLRGYTPASELLGIPVKTDPLEWDGKGPLLKIFQDLHAFSDSLDLCKFSAFAVGAPEYAALYETVVGLPMSEEDVMTAGERIYNLERYYNNLAGFDGSDDSLPDRFLNEPATGPAEGHICELDQMKEQYYDARGWDDGVVGESKLRELEIIS